MKYPISNVKYQMSNKFRFIRNLKFSAGFTLIELLIVIVIIGILSTFVLANFIGIRARARDAQRKTDLRQIQTALQLYNSDLGYYPSKDLLEECGTDVPFTGDSSEGNGTVTYMQAIPCDPKDKSTPYHYLPDNTDGTGVCLNSGNSDTVCTRYKLYACLENGSDSDIDEKKNPSDQNLCTDGTHSYTVINP